MNKTIIFEIAELIMKETSLFNFDFPEFNNFFGLDEACMYN